jgi:hypothetical protein
VLHSKVTSPLCPTFLADFNSGLLLSLQKVDQRPQHPLWVTYAGAEVEELGRMLKSIQIKIRPNSIESF